jgi:TonB family protein
MNRHRLLLLALCLLLCANYSRSNPVQDAASAAKSVDDAARATTAQRASRILIDAEQGNAMAQLIVGNSYRVGNGFPQDNIQAYKWLFLSAFVEGKQKENAAKLLDAVAAQMTPRQIEQARQLAAEWKPKPASSGSNVGMGGGIGAGVGPGPGVYAAGGDVTKPVGLTQPLPPYTDEARDARIEGIMLLKAVIRKDGSVTNVQVIRGLGYGLDERAVETIARKWRFQPGTKNGQPVNVLATIEVAFKLRTKPPTGEESAK